MDFASQCLLYFGSPALTSHMFKSPPQQSKTPVKVNQHTYSQTCKLADCSHVPVNRWLLLKKSC